MRTKAVGWTVAEPNVAPVWPQPALPSMLTHGPMAVITRKQQHVPGTGSLAVVVIWVVHGTLGAVADG